MDYLSISPRHFCSKTKAFRVNNFLWLTVSWAAIKVLWWALLMRQNLKSELHCKYIQCNFYSFEMCPNFHCNLTVWFTFNCCSKYSWIIADLQFFTVTSTLDCIRQLNVNPTVTLQWKMGHNSKLRMFAVQLRKYVMNTKKNCLELSWLHGPCVILVGQVFRLLQGWVTSWTGQSYTAVSYEAWICYQLC